MQISGPLKYRCQISCEPKSRIPPKPIDTIPSATYTVFKGTKMGCGPDQAIGPWGISLAERIVSSDSLPITSVAVLPLASGAIVSNPAFSNT